MFGCEAISCQRTNKYAKPNSLISCGTRYRFEAYNHLNDKSLHVNWCDEITQQIIIIIGYQEEYQSKDVCYEIERKMKCEILPERKMRFWCTYCNFTTFALNSTIVNRSAYAVFLFFVSLASHSQNILHNKLARSLRNII